MVSVEVISQKRFIRLARNLRNLVHPVPRIRKPKDLETMATLKESPLVLAETVFQGACLAGEFVNVKKGHRFIGKSASFINEQAEAGDTDAQFFIGLAHYHTHNDQQELNKSEYWIQRAAMSGNAHAMIFLVTLHLPKAGESETDANLALEWLKRAAKTGNVMALETLAEIHDKALCHLPKHDYHESFQYWRKAAILGSKKAMSVLAIRYYVGKGVWRNRRAAMKWFILALKYRYKPTMLPFAAAELTSKEITHEHFFKRALYLWVRSEEDPEEESMKLIRGFKSQPHSAEGVEENHC